MVALLAWKGSNSTGPAQRSAEGGFEIFNVRCLACAGGFTVTFYLRFPPSSMYQASGMDFEHKYDDQSVDCDYLPTEAQNYASYLRTTSDVEDTTNSPSQMRALCTWVVVRQLRSDPLHQGRAQLPRLLKRGPVATLEADLGQIAAVVLHGLSQP